MGQLGPNTPPKQSPESGVLGAQNRPQKLSKNFNFGCRFWTPFWFTRGAPFRDPKRSPNFINKSGGKVHLVLERLWRLSQAVLGAFLAVLELSWEGWCSKIPAKHTSKSTFSKLLLFAIVALMDRFRRPSWLILGLFGLRMDPNSIKTSSEGYRNMYPEKFRFWTLFGPPKWTPKTTEKIFKMPPKKGFVFPTPQHGPKMGG